MSDEHRERALLFLTCPVHVTMSHQFNAIINIRKHHSHHDPISSEVAHPFLDPSPTANSKSRGNLMGLVCLVSKKGTQLAGYGTVPLCGACGMGMGMGMGMIMITLFGRAN